MPLPDPDALLRQLNDNILTMRCSEALDDGERRRMADDFSDLFNYLSDLNKKPSAVHLLYSQSAREARRREEIERERSLLKEHEEFVAENLDKADQYLRTMQVAGYAAFFALWSFSYNYMPAMYGKTALILMLLSASAFILWEIWRATLTTLLLKRHASVTSNIEDFIKNRFHDILSNNATLPAHSRHRAWVWIACMVTALPSLLITLFFLFIALLSRYPEANCPVLV